MINRNSMQVGRRDEPHRTEPQAQDRKQHFGIVYTAAATPQQAQAPGTHRSQQTSKHEEQPKQTQADNRAAADTGRKHKLCLQILFFIATIVFCTLHNPHRILLAQHFNTKTTPASSHRLPSDASKHRSSHSTLIAKHPFPNDAPQRRRSRAPPTAPQSSPNTTSTKSTLAPTAEETPTPHTIVPNTAQRPQQPATSSTQYTHLHTHHRL